MDLTNSNGSALSFNLSQQNNTTNIRHYDLLKQPLFMIILYAIAYTTIFFCAVIGNIMVVAVVIRNKNMHSVTNYFIVNLAVADILVALFCVPLTLLSNLYTSWNFGWFMCKATPYLQGVSVCASVNTLAAIALDRYLAICRTAEAKINRKVCKVIIVCIWIAAFIIMVPWAVYFTLEEHYTGLQTVLYCYENWPNDGSMRIYFLAAIFLCCYSVPLSLIVFCYSLIGIKVWRRHAPGVKNTSMGIVHKSKVKAVQMLSVVVILFAFSWLPMYVIRLHAFFGTGTTPSIQKVIQEVIFPIAQWLGSSNSAMNPIIYCFFSKKFRTGFRDAITCCAKRRMNISRRSGIIRRAATVSLSNGTCHTSTPTLSVKSNNHVCHHGRSEEYL